MGLRVSNRRRGRTLWFAGALLAACSSSHVAYGQIAKLQAGGENDTDPPPRRVDQHEAASDGDDILVKASLSDHPATGASPITIITAPEIAHSGISSISDVLHALISDGSGTMPIAYGGNFAVGASGISLRGLGVSSTLVLMDGLRLPYYPLDDDGHRSFTDMGTIPLEAVDRIEILKDSGSSTYGSGAIGGVINVITKKTMTGVTAFLENGASAKGDAATHRASLTAGLGNYERRGFALFVGGEYEHDAALYGSDRGFPYDTADLTSIGGLNLSTSANRFPTTTANAVDARSRQLDLGDPFSGSTALIPSGTQANGQPFYSYTSLNTDCRQGSFTVATGQNRGTACIHNNEREFSQAIQPEQTYLRLFGRLVARLSDRIDLNVMANYSVTAIDVIGRPHTIRSVQPAGASPSLATSGPGSVVLPVYVCASGINCASAPDRRLNPNNPYAAAYAQDPQNGAARLYYLFGDIPSTTHSRNALLRGAVMLSGTLAHGSWTASAAIARQNLTRNYGGVIDIDGLKTAINTGAYDFVHPENNTQAVRDLVAPRLDAKATSQLETVDARLNLDVLQLPGGVLKLSIGGQLLHEAVNNPGANPDLDRFNYSAAARGSHMIVAGMVEAAVPVLTGVEMDTSARFDHYSEGFDRISPKIGFKLAPWAPLILRGSWSRNFTAPSFAESSTQTNLGSAISVLPPADFQLAHGGLISNGNENLYAQRYTVGVNTVGGQVRPQTADSLTFGLELSTSKAFMLGVTYYKIRETGQVTASAADTAAVADYYAGRPLPAGYSIARLDSPDPAFPDGPRRLVSINSPWINSGQFETAGLDLEARLQLSLGHGIGLSSRLMLTDILVSNSILADGTVQRFAGTLGPFQLTSGSGTPRWRGLWQSSLSTGKLTTTAILHYVSGLTNIAADISPSVDCADASSGANLYPAGSAFCHISSFAYGDLNLELAVTKAASLTLFIGNITGAKAPLVPTSYSGQNYLPAWHMAGVIGRSFRIGFRARL